jgi:hypothetical protein
MSNSNTKTAFLQRQSAVAAKPALDLGVRMINEAVVRNPFSSMKMHGKDAKVLLAI